MKTGNNSNVDIGLWQVNEWILESVRVWDLHSVAGSCFFLFGVCHPVGHQVITGSGWQTREKREEWILLGWPKSLFGLKKKKKGKTLWPTQYMRFYELALRVGYIPSTSSGIVIAQWITFSCYVARRRMELGKHLANITGSCPREENNTQFGYGGRSSTEPRPLFIWGWGSKLSLNNWGFVGN